MRRWLASLISLLSVAVIPKFKDVAAGMGVQLWPITLFTFALNDAHILIGFEMLLFFALLTVAALYVGGPGFVRWFQFRSVPVVDWLTWRIPWKQKKLQRAFSAMLAVLLDGGVPEAEAVRLAGESTANEICRRRARRVIAALEKGEKLDEAVRAFDDTGEFHWRLTNATHAHGGFLNALARLARGARCEGVSAGGGGHAFSHQQPGDSERPGGRTDCHRHVWHPD